MARYLVRRVIFSIPTIAGAGLLIFLALRLMPGDVVSILQQQESSMTAEQAETLRRVLGLDKPIWQQFADWVGPMLRGDFGVSLFTQRSVTDIIQERLVVTAELSLMSIVIGLLIAAPLGVISALRPNSFVDYVVRTLSIVSLAAPNYWLAIIALLVLSKWVGWLPPLMYQSPLDDPIANVQKLIVPAVILGTGSAGALTRYLRSSLLEVLRQDYINTARSKGLTEPRIVYRHALKNAFIPVFTILGFQFANIFGGSVIMEQIFSIPGMGQLTLTSIYQRDWAITQALTLMFAIAFVYVNIAVDVAYSWIDPRIRL